MVIQREHPVYRANNSSRLALDREIKSRVGVEEEEEEKEGRSGRKFFLRMLNYNLQLTDNRNERFDFLFVASSYKRTRGRRKRRNGPPVNGESNERGTNCGPNDRQMDRSISRITISRIGRRGNDLARRWPVNDVKFHPLSLNCSIRKKISPS